ncbi:MAG: methylated-DNA--[protein]-cysteine S-methyltransferase [Rhodospirillaceae bacterium]|nr:methylated-DNA--[protein]-cysteine S-methyltransferase [Rhodospirillaceae bacterium]MBT5514868.1 methylated-DNA--[protein]-cysteine S-methyltransferase [Rhodospirillaceae bacterium]
MMNTQTNAATRHKDYARIAEAIEFVVNQREDQPELADVADAVNLSPHHLQRLFTRWAGVSPKKFLKFLTLADAKARLDASASVLDAAFDAGLSGPGRLHDLFVTWDAVTPGEYKSRGDGMIFRYGFHPSPFGECLIVLGDRGITGVAFVTDAGAESILSHQQRGWERANWRADQTATKPFAAQVFLVNGTADQPFSVMMRGTPFQTKVWEALLKIPSGAVTTYGQLAARIDAPRAARAVGTACGANRVGFLIPCHRVIRDSGAITGYRWGPERKRAMLAWEAAQEATQAAA